MNTVKPIFILIALIFIITVAPANAASKDKKDGEIVDALVIKNGITVTEIEESGKERFRFTGTHGETTKKNKLRIYNVRATIVQDNGKEILFMTEAADYDKAKRELTSEKYVEIVSDDGIMTGVGMYLNTEKNMFRLLNNVQIDTLQKSEDIGLGIPE